MSKRPPNDLYGVEVTIGATFWPRERLANGIHTEFVPLGQLSPHPEYLQPPDAPHSEYDVCIIKLGGKIDLGLQARASKSTNRV